MATQTPTMTKVRPNILPQREGSPSPARRTNGRPSAAIRIAVSVLLVWHLAGLVLAPLSVQPTSWLVMRLAQRAPMQWYLDALYLNHGYHFFAPNPGPGRLVQWEILDERGGVKEQGRFPSTKDQWPRLRYHRHFMLADQTAAGPDEPDSDRWKRAYLEAFARHILRESDGRAVRVRWIEHELLEPGDGYNWAEHQREAPDEPYRGRKPDDPSTYRTLLEVIQRRGDLGVGVEATDQTNLWQNGRQNIASPWTGVTR